MDEDVSESPPILEFSQISVVWPIGFKQFFADPLIAMEHILDSLKLLDYENQFCKQK